MWIDSQIIKPSAEEKSRYEQQFKDVTNDGRIKGMNYAMLTKFGNALEKVEKEILKQIGLCFAVDYMATHPTHKGRGVASMMVREVLKQVDTAALNTIVMANIAGKGMYEKQGFISVQTLAQDFKKYGISEPYVHYWLIRAPSPNAISM